MRVMCSGVSMPPDMVPCESDEPKVRATFIALPPNKMLNNHASASTIMRTRHTASAHGHAHSRAHAAARLPVSGLELDTSFTTVKQEARSIREPRTKRMESCSRPPMPVRRKWSVRFRIGFLPGAGGYRWVPYIRAHAACNATQRRPRRSIPTRHCIGKITCSRHGGAAFGLRCTRELCVLRSCEDPRPGSARAQSRSRRRRARTSES